MRLLGLQRVLLATAATSIACCTPVVSYEFEMARSAIAVSLDSDGDFATATVIDLEIGAAALTDPAFVLGMPCSADTLGGDGAFLVRGADDFRLPRPIEVFGSVDSALLDVLGELRVPGRSWCSSARRVRTSSTAGVDLKSAFTMFPNQAVTRLSASVLGATSGSRKVVVRSTDALSIYDDSGFPGLNEITHRAQLWAGEQYLFVMSQGSLLIGSRGASTSVRRDLGLGGFGIGSIDGADSVAYVTQASVFVRYDRLRDESTELYRSSVGSEGPQAVASVDGDFAWALDNGERTLVFANREGVSTSALEVAAPIRASFATRVPGAGASVLAIQTGDRRSAVFEVADSKEFHLVTQTESEITAVVSFDYEAWLVEETESGLEIHEYVPGPYGRCEEAAVSGANVRGVAPWDESLAVAEDERLLEYEITRGARYGPCYDDGFLDDWIAEQQAQ